MGETTLESVDRLRRVSRTPSLVEVAPTTYLALDGEGDPNTSLRYQAAVSALFAVAYTLRFALKRTGGPDQAVGPLEGLWWAEGTDDFRAVDRPGWRWTMMIRRPDPVDAAVLAAAQHKVAAGKGIAEALELRSLRLEEGRCAQVMHHGPFTEEGPTIDALHAFVAGQGLTLRGRHHEIYLSDIRRVEAPKWRTVIRQPVS